MFSNTILTMEKDVFLHISEETQFVLRLTKDGKKGATFAESKYTWKLTDLGVSTEIQDKILKGTDELILEEFTKQFFFVRDSLLKDWKNPNTSSNFKTPPSSPPKPKAVPKQFETVKGSSGSIVVPKGYFAKLLPAQVVKYLADAKKMRKKELAARIERLNQAAAKLHSLTEDKYAGDFGLWLNTLYIFAKSPDNLIREHVWELSNQTLALMAKGRSHALPSLRKAYTRILEYKPALTPIGVVNGQNLYQTYAEVAASNIKPQKEKILKLSSDTSKRVSDKVKGFKGNAKQRVNSLKMWLVRKKDLFVKKTKNFLSRVNPQNEEDGTEKEDIVPTIAEPFVVLKRVISICLVNPISSAFKSIWNWVKA